MRIDHWSVAAAMALAMLAAPALSTGAVPVNPIVNGDFESPNVPSAVHPALEAVPVDCVGIGHQALYGTDSPQQDAEDAATAASGGDPDGAATNLEGLTQRDLARDAQNQTGVNHCVHNDQEGYGMVFLDPDGWKDQAVGWSVHDPEDKEPGATFGFYFDDDPFDREVLFPPGPDRASHSLWQSFLSTQQAWTGNFDALTFDLEAGSVPSNSAIILSFSASPLEAQHPWLGIFIECQLAFSGTQLDADEDGHVIIDPLEGTFSSRYDPGCGEAAQAWSDEETTDEDRRDILGRLRIVQFSFWNWHTRDQGQEGAPVVVDNIALEGATTVAEEAAAGNLNEGNVAL